MSHLSYHPSRMARILRPQLHETRPKKRSMRNIAPWLSLHTSFSIWSTERCSTKSENGCSAVTAGRTDLSNFNLLLRTFTDTYYLCPAAVFPFLVFVGSGQSLLIAKDHFHIWRFLRSIWKQTLPQCCLKNRKAKSQLMTCLRHKSRTKVDMVMRTAVVGTHLAASWNSVGEKWRYIQFDRSALFEIEQAPN